MTDDTKALTTGDPFGHVQIRETQETAVAAVEAHAKAAVSARWLMAMKNPRDLDTVRERLLKECHRPTFAKVARYRKPIGNEHREGLSIRFAEEALRCMTNIYSETPVVYDDDDKRIVNVQVTDLETNVTFGSSIVIAKRIERRNVPKGETVLNTRVGSGGQRLYILKASDDQILDRQNALISKALRTHGLRHVPGWLLDECESLIGETQCAEAAADPDLEKRKILDAYGGIGITAEALKAYVGHDLEHFQPQELADLRALYQAIADGETTFVDAMEATHGTAAKAGKPTKADKAAKAAIDAAKGGK